MEISKTPTKLHLFFFGGDYYICNSKGIRVKKKMTTDVFEKSSIDELNELLVTDAKNKDQLIHILKERFNEKIGFFVINRKYLVHNPIFLVSYFFSEEEINERVIFSKKEKKLITYTQVELGNIHLFCEQRSEISYDLKNTSIISNDELDHLIKKHKQQTYIVYNDMFFLDPYEFWVVFGFFDNHEKKYRRTDYEYFKAIFNFCEEGSISFVERNKIKKSELEKSAYKKIDMLEKYNKRYVKFKKLKEKNVYNRVIAKRIGITQHVSYYFSSAFNFENNEKNNFLIRDHFRYYRK